MIGNTPRWPVGQPAPAIADALLSGRGTTRSHLRRPVRCADLIERARHRAPRRRDQSAERGVRPDGGNPAVQGPDTGPRTYRFARIVIISLIPSAPMSRFSHRRSLSLATAWPRAGPFGHSVRSGGDEAGGDAGLPDRVSARSLAR